MIRASKSWSAHTARLFILFNSLFLLLVCTITAAYISSVLRRTATEYAEDTLQHAVVHLDSNLSDVRSRIIRLTQLDSVKQCLQMQPTDIAQMLVQERVMDQYLRGITLFRSDIEDILILGANGYRYNLSKREDLLSGYDFTNAPWYWDATPTDDGIFVHIFGPFAQDYYIPRFKGSTAGQQTIAMSMVVFNNRREPIGAVVCTFNLEAMAQLFVQSSPQENRRTALVSPQDIVVSQSGHQGIGEKLLLTEKNAALLHDNERGMFTDSLKNGASLFHFTSPTAFPGWKLVSYLSLSEVYASVWVVLWILVAFLGVYLLCNAFIARLLSRSIQKPVVALVNSVRDIDEAHLTLIPDVYPYTELEQIASKFNELLANLNTLIQSEYLAQIALTRAQLDTLQAQIRPHFLFNTLQMLQTEILCGDFQAADQMIVSFSRLLRYTMQGESGEVLLSQEADYVRDYLALVGRRYPKGLHVDIEISPEAACVPVPKLLLQPLVENSVKHGFVDTFAEGASIRLDAAVEADVLCLRIADNGAGIPAARLAEVLADMQHDEAGSGIGLRNVHQRIRMLYGAGYGLDLISGAQGTTVWVRLPVRQEARGA